MLLELDALARDGARVDLAEVLRSLCRWLVSVPQTRREDAAPMLDDLMTILASSLDQPDLKGLSTGLADVRRLRLLPRFLATIEGRQRAPARSAQGKAAAARDPDGPVERARRASEAELMALAHDPALPEALTNVIVSRGSRAVLHAVARNHGAVFARSSLTTLVELAPSDKGLKDALVSRSDLPEPIVERLIPFLNEASKARLLTNGAPLTRAAAEREIDAAKAELVHAYREGQTPLGVDSYLAMVDAGTKTYADAVSELTRELRLPELAVFLATRLDADVATVLNVLFGRLDHAVAVLMRAAGNDESAVVMVMDMRRRCGLREARETRNARATFQRYAPDEARRLVGQFQAVLEERNPAASKGEACASEAAPPEAPAADLAA